MKVTKHKHIWKESEYKTVFSICKGYEGDERRVKELCAIFKDCRPNGLRMKIEKYEYLNGDQQIRPFFQKIPKKMLTAWEVYKIDTA